MTYLYIASYGKNKDKGIYIVSLNKETQALSLLEQVSTDDYPSYMICKDNHLFVGFKNASRNNNGGGVGCYAINNDKLDFVDYHSSHGRSYTHLCVDDDNKYLFTANYHVGATASYLLEDFKVVEKIGAVHHFGLGPDLLKRQTRAHAHYVGFTPDRKWLYSVDLGADKIVMYNYDNGILQEDEEHTLNLVPGSGPRHMIFSKDGRFAYIINEIANSVMVFSYRNGLFILLQDIRCKPRHFKEFSSAAAIKMTSNGNHLFVSNRGHNSIAMYRVNKETGKLSLLYMVHTGGLPRDFNIIDDKYLVVACEQSNSLELLTFDEEKEELVKTDSSLEIPAPVCVAINK